MIDYGLLMSAIVTIVAVWAAEQVWPLRTVAADAGYIDTVMIPAFVGLVVGRLVTLALDDPGSIGSIRDMLVIRSGVEFWPGLLAASLVAAWAARSAWTRGSDRLADLAPITLVGYGAYEASCLFRDGCFGPHSPIGLHPDGFDVTMLPVGLTMAAAAVASAATVRRLQDSTWPSSAVVAAAVAMLALVRATGSIWLPHVGTGPTRQQSTSILVAVAAGLICAGILTADRRRQPVPVGA